MKKTMPVLNTPARLVVAVGLIMLVSELLDLQARGRKRESLAGLGELHGLRDALLERLQTLSASAENLKPGQFELTTC